MNILLVDDHRLVADAMAIMLEDLAENVTVTTCHTTQRALTVVDQDNNFDMILTDLFMPGIDGLGFLHGLQSRNITAPIVVVSGTEDTKIVQNALDQGAAGFIQKSLPGAEMLMALRKVLTGEKYIPAGLDSVILPSSNGCPSKVCPTANPTDTAGKSEKDTVAQNYTNKITADSDTKLGSRQIEVLQLMADGHSNKQIAQVLEISEATVKYHASLLFKALSAHNRTSCIKEGLKRNLIHS